MSEYQLVPYTYTIHVARNQSELRDLANIDQAGLSALEFIAQATRAHMGPPRLQIPDASTAMQVQKVAYGSHVVVVTAASGLRGVRADVVRRRNGTTTTIDVTEADWTHTPVRNVFLAPPGKVGVALVERVGPSGVVTKLELMLRQTLKARYPDLLFTMKPAMSPEAIQAWAENATVKSIVLRQTNTKLGQQAQTVAGLPFGQVIEFRAPRRKSWGSTLFGGQLRQETQKQILTEVVPNIPGVSPDEAETLALQMLEDGWTVSLAMRKDGRQRLVQLATKASITMTFPASAKGIVGARPEHGDFKQACQGALQEMSDDDMPVGEPADCDWADAQWDDGQKAWKAVWGVPE